VPRCLGDALVRWATTAPERTFLAERRHDGSWRTVTYGAALTAVRGLGEVLLARGLSATRPLALLSGNGVDHALLQLAGMHVGVPVAPLSPAYALLSQDHQKLRAMIDDLAPGAIYASDGVAFARALVALGRDVPLLCSHHHEAAPLAPGQELLDVADAARTAPSLAVDRAFAALSGDTVAKILFTSGSTGTPKGVINTQRMLCANQAALAAGWPLLTDRPPVIVDWLPWSHTFGGNHNFNLILTHGGTLYVDGGKPAPGAIDETIRNLREIPTTMYFNVPRGFDLLVEHLERDAALRDTFFADLDLMFYAAAALSPATWDRLVAVSGGRAALVSAWGSTETSPLAAQVHFPIDRAGVIGLPVPGVELALAPAGDKLELRVRGPSVTPGYWRKGGGIDPAPTDELGFYPMGDAGKLADPDAPEQGLVFDGRLAENFKLGSGTWVHVGELRIALLAACSPLLADAVITGHDRVDVGALLFLAPGRAASMAVKGELAAGLARLAASRLGAAATIARGLILDEPPQIDAGEITDKGYLNQRAILARRAALVERLHDDEDAAVIRPLAP
jgi:feruloyl-CoA synthase